MLITHKQPDIDGQLKGFTIAILATDGVEESELTEPREAFEAAGARTVLVSPKHDSIQAWKHHDKGDEIAVDLPLANADPMTFDGLFLPGGALNPDALRMDANAVDFVKAFANAEKPIAAICHGAATLVEAEALHGRTVTSWPSIKTDLENAGATWVDKEVCVDQNLITSRKPDDIPAFNVQSIAAFVAYANAAEGTPARAATRVPK